MVTVSRSEEKGDCGFSRGGSSVRGCSGLRLHQCGLRGTAWVGFGLVTALYGWKVPVGASASWVMWGFGGETWAGVKGGWVTPLIRYDGWA